MNQINYTKTDQYVFFYIIQKILFLSVYWIYVTPTARAKKIPILILSKQINILKKKSIDFYHVDDYHTTYTHSYDSF